MLHIDTGAVSGAQSTIAVTSVADPTVPGVGQLTVSAVFWNGTAEATVVDALDATQQIRIKVSGYTAGQEGAAQRVRLMRVN